MAGLAAPHFASEEEARRFLESVRWPHDPLCPHCGGQGAWPIRTRPHARANGRTQKARAGLYKCAQYPCGRQFTVTVGTVFERSKVPLTQWITAVYLLGSGRRGISVQRLHRILGVTYKTAWLLAQRIRAAAPEDSSGSSGREQGLAALLEALCAHRAR